MILRLVANCPDSPAGALFTAVVFVSLAAVVAAQRRALLAGYRLEMKGRFIRALAPAEQRRFMRLFGSCALLLSLFRHRRLRRVF